MPKLYMLIKQMSELLPRNLAVLTFDELLIAFSTKLNLLYSPAWRRSLLQMIKQKFFGKNSDLDDSGISLPAFPSRISVKLHNISVTSKMVNQGHNES